MEGLGKGWGRSPRYTSARPAASAQIRDVFVNTNSRFTGG